MEICWLSKSKKLGLIVPPTKTSSWKHDVIQQTTELNIVATDDQEDHKVGKLAEKTIESVELSSG